jgi:hypothetical protein
MPNSGVAAHDTNSSLCLPELNRKQSIYLHLSRRSPLDRLIGVSGRSGNSDLLLQRSDLFLSCVRFLPWLPSALRKRTEVLLHQEQRHYGMWAN